MGQKRKARAIAYDCLKQIRLHDGYIQLVLKQELEKAEEADKGMITEMVYGSCRNWRLVRYQWEGYASRKVKEDIAILLDMAAYQLHFMSQPAYAIVNEMVELAPKGQRGFVNAILHKVTEQELKHSEDIGIEYSIPDWVVKMWTAHYGAETTEKIASSMQGAATLIGRINTLKTDKKELEKDEHFRFIDELAFTYEGNILKTDWFTSGKVVIQDIASQQVVKQLDVKDGMKVLDACSAPGTKSSQMAMYMHDNGHIVALDIHEHRVELIREMSGRLGIRCIEPLCLDATRSFETFGQVFDRILVDAPCSGLGVMKRKPDIRFSSSPDKIDEIVSLQHDILASAAMCLKEEGILVYSTCTLNKKENERQVQRFLKEHEDFELIEEKTIFPFDMEGDGFYHARIIRRGKGMVE